MFQDTQLWKLLPHTAKRPNDSSQSRGAVEGRHYLLSINNQFVFTTVMLFSYVHYDLCFLLRTFCYVSVHAYDLQD